MLNALSRLTLRPKPIKQQISVANISGITNNIWQSAWINRLWIRKLSSDPTVFSANSGTVNYTVYRTWENQSHILAWVPGVYEITIKQNGGGGGGGDDFYSDPGEGGDGAVSDTTYTRGWRVHSASAGLYRLRLPNVGTAGLGQDYPTLATPGGSGGQRLTSDITPTAHAGGRGVTGGGTDGYTQAGTGNGGDGGDGATLYPGNHGDPGGWGYTNIRMIG